MALWIRSLPLLVLLAVLAPTAIYTQENYEHLCGSSLVDALVKICGEQGINKRNIEQSLVDMLLGNKVPFHLAKRGIVEQCCDSICSRADLETYCK
ncbi:insulin [Varanus komodoensis]|uniref:insulin n=1 Tax=Varanus komodoensis TaxID=61221 RepID=UPI001CF773E6|nr:insulin [Varanus komodoensis]